MHRSNSCDQDLRGQILGPLLEDKVNSAIGLRSTLHRAPQTMFLFEYNLWYVQRMTKIPLLAKGTLIYHPPPVYTVQYVHCAVVPIYTKLQIASHTPNKTNIEGKRFNQCYQHIQGVYHGLINYKDTKPQSSSLLVFNRVYRLEVQSIM